MIDRASIMAWNEFVPWTDFAMVEQDLIISRALVDIFSDDFPLGRICNQTALSISIYNAKTTP